MFSFCPAGRSSLEAVLKKLGNPEGKPMPVGKLSAVGKLEGKPSPLQEETFLAGAACATEASCNPSDGGSGSGAGLADTVGRTTLKSK